VRRRFAMIDLPRRCAVVANSFAYLQPAPTQDHDKIVITFALEALEEQSDH
jgi:hypothetical protein